MRGRARSRSSLIVVLLVAMLAMTVTLAYEAQQAARSHRVATENVLRDYAAFAAWELSRVAGRELFDLMLRRSQALHDELERGSLDTALSGVFACKRDCRGTPRVRTLFHARSPDARLSFAGQPVDPRVREMLTGIAAGVLGAPDKSICPALAVTWIDGAPAVLVWRPLIDRSNVGAGIIGFVASGGLITSVFEELLKQTPLLPPSLVPEGTPNDVLAVRVATREGQRLFASSDDWSAYASDQSFTRELGALRLSVAVRPEAAGRLVIGGLPRERLPLVLGLLGMTATLVVVALVQLRREAELSRLRSDFVSGVSHELRTPLAQIRMFSETLLLGRVRSESEGRRSLEIITRETQRLSQLVENVLFFARGERRRPQIAPEAARLAPILAEVVESFAPLAATREARVVTELDEAAWAKLDPGALRQVLLNMLDNAVKYGPPGQSVLVRLSLDGERARLVVEDEGPGIDLRDAERIWLPFSRLPGTAAATGGAGIGLTIVRQLVELHGGRAWVERGAKGARFVVEIPGAWSEPGASSAVA